MEISVDLLWCIVQDVIPTVGDLRLDGSFVSPRASRLVARSRSPSVSWTPRSLRTWKIWYASLRLSEGMKIAEQSSARTPLTNGCSSLALSAGLVAAARQSFMNLRKRS